VDSGPLGVVAAIMPFNFPLILAGSKIAPALAAGNTVLHKPADETPLSALYMAGLLKRAGVPDGVVNVVTGSGPVAGEALLRNPGIDKVAFTGSTAVGRHAASVAGAALKPVTTAPGPARTGRTTPAAPPDHHYPFADIEQAVRDMSGGKTINPVLTF
jgi:phenylacetaldehyde dehydrogenase